VAETRILIVGDDVTAALELKHRVEQLGYAVLATAASLETGIDEARRTQLHLVLMPVGSRAAAATVETAERHRARFRAPTVYIIDRGDGETLQRARQTNPCGCLPQPFDEEELSAAIEMALHTDSMEKALHTSRRRYRLLARSVSDVIWTTDLDLRATDVTPSVSRVLGYSLEEALRRGMVEMLTPSSLEAARRAVADLQAATEREASDSEGTQTVELAFTHKDGTTIWTDVRVSMVRFASSGPNSLLWVLDDTPGQTRTKRGNKGCRHPMSGDDDDVTERARAEKALRKTNQELRSFLQDRIAQLEHTNAQLTRALEERKCTENKLGELNREWLSLQAAAAATASSLDLQFVLETVTWEMTGLLKVEGCALFRWNQETDTISVIADYGSPQGQRSKEEICSMSDHSLRKRVLTERYAQQVTIDEINRLDGERTYMQEEDIKSLLMLPMIYQDRVIGLVEMRSCRENRVFSDREISLAQMLSTEAASAIENARLYRRAQREIAQRMQVEEELKASLQEKEALLQEIHHRVKNNLQVICSLLNLQSRRIEDRDTLQMFRESQDRVRSMALIHERLYCSQDMAKVDFGDYLRDLTNQMVRSYRSKSNQVKLTVSADDVGLSLDKAVPCGLVTNELISNAMKHAFPDGRDGEIHVSLRSDHDQRLTLCVADNGVGLPGDLDIDARNTLGLQLIRVLTRQMGGTTELHSSHEDGTEVSITFGAS
jgi:PAS domain S-box-containing protein